MKRTMFFLAMLATVLRGLSLTLELFFPNPQMPLAILVCCGVFILLGVGLVILSLTGHLKFKFLQIFFVADLCYMLTTLLFFGSGTLIMEVRWYEVPMMGNLLQVLVNLLVLFFSLRRHHYIRIKSDFSEDTDTLPKQ